MSGTIINSSTVTAESSTAQSSISLTEPGELKFHCWRTISRKIFRRQETIEGRTLGCAYSLYPQKPTRYAGAFVVRRKLAGSSEPRVSPHASAGFRPQAARIQSDSRFLLTNYQNRAWMGQLGKRPCVMEQNQYPLSNCRKPLRR